MRFSEEIFRSYDIRGTTDQLTEELAFQVGAACVVKTGAKTVVVGRDMRETSPKLAKSVIAGINSQGANAVDIGMCSTSIFNFAVSAYPEHEAGVMITASHNPAEYNGFKMYDSDSLPLSGQEMAEIIEKDYQKADEPGSVTEININSAYLDKIFSMVHLPTLSKLKIVVDGGNGMGGIILPDLFERLDCEMVPIYFEPDGTFPNHEANPLKTETLNDLKDRVKTEKADLGIALDGDADRVIFVDENGDHIKGDIMLALLATERLEENKGKAVVWSPNASWAIRDAVEKTGGQSILEKVGRTNIIHRMRSEDTVIGGEVSAHYFYPELSSLESTDLTILLVLKMLADSGGTTSELIAPFRTYQSPGEINFEVSDKDMVIENLVSHYSKDANEVNDLDGVRIEYNDWWFNIRKSNTEPLIRLNLEAATKELMVQKLEELSQFINQNS